MDINIISKRDTLLAATKRVLIELLRHKGKVISVQAILETLSVDFKKIYQVLFVLQGIGFLIFVSPNKIIYPGVISSIHIFLNFVKDKLAKQDSEQDGKEIGVHNFNDPSKTVNFEMPIPGKEFGFSEITLNKQIIDANGMHYLSEFIGQIVNEILFDNSRLTR